jgi:hypothetical protein
MTSPNLTTVLLPPATGRSIGRNRADRALGLCPRGPDAASKLGKIRSPQMGRIHRPLRLAGNQRRTRPLVVGILAEQMPAEHGELACHGDRCDLVTTSGSDTQEKRPQRAWCFGGSPGRLDSMARAWLRPRLLMRPCCARPRPDWRTRGFNPT